MGQLKYISALLDAGGQIMLGMVKPTSDAAVAHDGKKTLAMLRRRSADTVPDLLAQIDAAVAAAQSAGSRVDEINKPNSDFRYEILGSQQILKVLKQFQEQSCSGFPFSSAA